MTKKSIGIWILLLALLAAVFAEMAHAASPRMGKGRYAGMVLIPAGPFTMGRNDGPLRRNPRIGCFFPLITSTGIW